MKTCGFRDCRLPALTNRETRMCAAHFPIIDPIRREFEVMERQRNKWNGPDERAEAARELVAIRTNVVAG